MTFLDEVVKEKKRVVKALKSKTPLRELKKLAYEGEKRPFLNRFSQRFPEEVRIIAEVKKASPSKGILAYNKDISQLLKDYEQGGACAVSVITEERYFKGALTYIVEARKTISLPVLRKDFIVDEYELYQTKAAAADAVLLIGEILESHQLAEYLEIAREIDLDVLLEIHSLKTYEKIAHLNGFILGINNRNLGTLRVDLSVSVDVLRSIPQSCPVIIESGIETRKDIERFFEWGVSGFLIGSSLMLSGSPLEKLKELRGGL